MLVPRVTADPLEPVLELLQALTLARPWENLGSLPVADWLRPVPQATDRMRIAAEHFAEFTDRDGCRGYADQVRQWVDMQVLRASIQTRIPCMIAVDHCLTGGAYGALADHYGRENLSLIILDSHTDAVPMAVGAQAILYDIETNPQSVYDPRDPLLYDRGDSYNASTFLHHLLAEEIVTPQNVYLIGVSDYPDKKAQRIKDARIAAHVNVFKRLQRRGVKIITKKDLRLKPAKLTKLLKQIKTPYTYLSVDMDIGARNALDGVRFRNWQGLSEPRILRVVDDIGAVIKRGIKLAGMDLTEFNPRTAGVGGDGTYRIAAEIIRRIAFGGTA